MTRRFWESAPRQLRFTRAGRVLVLIALVTGFAAINTGNNLLFLGWGLVLSAIALSGLLSEATLRGLTVGVSAPLAPRALEPAHVPLTVFKTTPRLPAYALELAASLTTSEGETQAWGPFLLRLAPRMQKEVLAHFVPKARGRHTLTHVTAKTAYPFGFFEKSRRLSLPSPLGVFVGPARLDVSELARDVLARAGEALAARPGDGDEFFGLRPYHLGDDVRRVVWRRVAKTRRWVLREHEAPAGRALVIELRLAARMRAGDPACEHAIAVACSLCEALLERGYRVGFLGPGLELPADSGPMQATAVVQAMARLDPSAAMPLVARGARASKVVVAADGAPASEHEVLVYASRLDTRAARGAA